VKVTRGREAGGASEQRGSTFVGTVWADPVLAQDDAPTVNTVVFTPRARTNWHRHERGQLLFVTHGSGYVKVRDGEGTAVTAGDVVWFPPGEVHWHGAGPETIMSHLAISLGTTSWLEPVTELEYEDSF
jgi:quercetin dioxygenase-like cupin family protein